jgi:hypothetical protein
MDNLELFEPDYRQLLCSYCEGKGLCYLWAAEDSPRETWQSCPRCAGRGWVPDQVDEDEVLRMLLATAVQQLVAEQFHPPDVPFSGRSPLRLAYVADPR